MMNALRHVSSYSKEMLFSRVAVCSVFLSSAEILFLGAGVRAQDTTPAMEWEMVSTIKMSDLAKKGKPGEKLPVGFMRGKAKGGKALKKKDGGFRQGSEDGKGKGTKVAGKFGTPPKSIMPKKWRVVSYEEYKLKVDNCFCEPASSIRDPVSKSNLGDLPMIVKPNLGLKHTVVPPRTPITLTTGPSDPPFPRDSLAGGSIAPPIGTGEATNPPQVTLPPKIGGMVPRDQGLKAVGRSLGDEDMVNDRGRPLSPKEFIPLDRGGTKEMDAKEGGGGKIRRDRQAARDQNDREP